MQGATRAAVHDDRFERQGAACLWTAAAEARPLLGAALRGEVRWQTPDGYVELERPPEREGGPRARRADVGRKSTQVLVTKVGPAAYAVSVNGETVALPDGVARSGRQPVTLTSFEGPYCGADNDAQTVVGPVSLGLLAANGQRPPTSARVTVVQRAMVNGDEFFEQVLSEAELPCGDAQAASLPVLAIPFPARFTESPFIEVQNVAAERAAQVKAIWDSVKSFLYLGMLLLLFWLAPITATAASALGVQGTYFEWIFKVLVPQNVALAVMELPKLFAERVLGTTAQNQESQGRMLRFLATFAAPILRLVRYDRIAGMVGQATTGLLAGGDLNDQAASMAQSTFTAVISATEEPYGRKDYHKYTLRAVVRTLRALMAQDVRTSVAQAASLDDEQRETDARPQSVFSDHKNETTMLDYLNEDETIFGEFANWFSGILQFTGLGLFGKKYDATGKAQSGLLFTQVGKPRLRGMDPMRLRVNYVTTQILVDIVDSEGNWKLAIEASAETGFTAGYYASGVAEDVRELNRTIEEFSQRHEKVVALLRSDAAASAGPVAQQTAAERESNAALFYSLGLGISKLEERASGPLENGLQPPSSEQFDETRSTYRRIKRGVREVTTRQLAKGARKFKQHIGPSLTAFANHNGGLSLMLECDLGAMLAPPIAGIEPLARLPAAVLRVRPQRVVMDALTYSMSTVDYVGVSLTDQVYEETSTGHPIDGAIDECRRSLQSYGRSLTQLWSLWESRSATRMRWYELFELREGESDALNAAAKVSTVGAGRLAFTADGVLFPLEVRDRLEWWVDGRPDPELANAIGLVSTKPPTRYSDTKEAREQANASPNGDAEQVPAPKTLAELLAAQAIADCLAARTVARATLPKAMRVSTNATDAVRSMVPRILEVLSASRIDDPTGIGGVLADNDPLFACVPGGIEAARLLHCLGAWRRREDVTLAVNAPVARLNIDLTRARKVARSNAWPKEAEAQLKAVSAALRRVSVRAFAAMPIYALQNTLAWTEQREPDALTARLCEAVASFDRTEQLALELGLAPAAVNPIRLRVVAHWPVVLSARIGLQTDADFRELLTRIAPTVEAWKSEANDRAKPLLGSSGAGILAALAARNARLRVDRAHLEAPDLEGDRAPTAKDEPVDRAYFVPFAHGSPPHSHIWSPTHPGSRGLDSVPIGAGYLSRAIRDCKAAAPGGDDAADVTIRGDEASTHPFGIALRRGASERAIRAQCHLVAVTSAEPVGASASPAPLDLGLAAEALVQGTGEAQRGSLVDVIGWNAERLLQAALLTLNANGKCALIECTPPSPAAPQMELVDKLRSRRERDSHTRLLKWEVMVAVGAHQIELRRVYGEAEDLHRDLLINLIKMRNQGGEGADNIKYEIREAWLQQDRGYFGKVVDEDDFGFSSLAILGADDGKRAEATGAVVDERVATKEDYAKVRGSADGTFMWSEERAKAFRDGSVLEKRAYTSDEALKYDCAHVESFVAKMSEDERDQNEASAREWFLKFIENKYQASYNKAEQTVSGQTLELGEGDGDRAKLDWDYAMASRQRLHAREGDAGDPELEAARNHVNAKQTEYVEHLSRAKNVEARLKVAKDAQKRLAATLGARSNDAFHASVALAGAMLKALLGEDRAPRLRVAAGAAPPAWIAQAEALQQDRLLSLFEVALVFDQLVRGAE